MEVILADQYLLPDEASNHAPRHPAKEPGQKPPLKPKIIRAIRIRQQIRDRPRDLFPGRIDTCTQLTTRQYARIPEKWVASIGLDAQKFGTHPLRRTGQLGFTGRLVISGLSGLLWHTTLEGTVRYPGIEFEDALAISEQVDL
jgi:hypothetical protein